MSLYTEITKSLNDIDNIKNILSYNILDIHFNEYFLFSKACDTINIPLIKYIIEESEYRDERIPNEIMKRYILHFVKKLAINLAKIDIVQGNCILFDKIPVYKDSYLELVYLAIIDNSENALELLFQVSEVENTPIIEVLKEIYQILVHRICNNKIHLTQGIISKFIERFDFIHNVFMELLTLAFIDSNKPVVMSLLNSDQFKHHDIKLEFPLWAVISSGLLKAARIVLTKIKYKASEYNLENLLMINSKKPHKSILILMEVTRIGIRFNFNTDNYILIRKFCKRPKTIALLLSLSYNYPIYILRYIKIHDAIMKYWIKYWSHYFTKNTTMIYNRVIAELNAQKLTFLILKFCLPCLE